MASAATPAKNGMPNVKTPARRGPKLDGPEKGIRSSSPACFSARGRLDRAPLMQSRQASLPRSSVSSDASTDLPQTSHVLPKSGGSSPDAWTESDVIRVALIEPLSVPLMEPLIEPL